MMYETDRDEFEQFKRILEVCILLRSHYLYHHVEEECCTTIQIIALYETKL